MRVGMAMVGSRGDIQPFAALAHALVRDGHEVTATANADAAGLVAATGASFVPIGMDVHAMLSSQQGSGCSGAGRHGNSWISRTRPAECSIVTMASRLGTPVLLAYSAAVYPRPRDWHPDSLLTGYWRLPAQGLPRGCPAAGRGTG